MTTVRCPRCGTTNPNGRRRLAYCRRCHEALGKCRYCKHYDFRLADCTHLSRRTDERIVDPDDMLNCVEFSSVLSGTAGPVVTPRHRLNPILLLGALALAAAIVLPNLLTQPTETASTWLRTAVDAPPTVTQDEDLPVTVMVSNQGKQPARDVHVFVSGRSLSNLICQYTAPAEAFVEASPRVVCATLGNVPPGEVRSVAFHLSASRPGQLKLTVHITAANLATTGKLAIECQVVP